MKGQAKLRETPSGMAATVSSEVHTKMAENGTQDNFLSANLKKNGGFAFFFSQVNQALSFVIVVWDSKLLSRGNWGKLGPF